MPLAEKGARGKGQQPFSPPSTQKPGARIALRIEVVSGVRSTGRNFNLAPPQHCLWSATAGLSLACVAIHNNGGKEV
jgi:hypothetical protein